jgi:alkyl hydroperoxide reductase subunit AhpF
MVSALTSRCARATDPDVMDSEYFDVVILGGGPAGGCLKRQV